MAKPSPNYLRILLDRFEPDMRQAFLDAVAQIRDQAEQTRIIDALKEASGDAAIDAVVRAVGLDPTDFQLLERGIRESFLGSAQATVPAVPVIRLPSAPVLRVRFDARNPRAESWIANRSGTLIRQITDDQLAAIRAELTAGLAAGDNPRTTARRLIGAINPKTGRREGGIIGLTEQQAEYTRNYLAELRSGDPTLMRRALDRKLRDRRFDSIVRRAIQAEQPVPAEAAELLLGRYRDRMVAFRAEVIARTETMEALHQAQREVWAQAVDQGVVQQQTVRRYWKTAGDERVRASHREIPKMNPGGVGLDEPFDTPFGPVMAPPAEPQCLPAETLVLAGDVVAASRRVFNGELVILKTAKGHELACTPNHPILGISGFSAAQFIKVGDQVICGGFGQREAMTSGHVDCENAPTRVDDLFESLLIEGDFVGTAEVPVSTHHFHGDGLDGDVAIVRAKSPLWRKAHPSGAKHIDELTLEFGAPRDAAVVCLSAADESVDRSMRARRGGMGFSDLARSFVGGHLNPLDALGLGLSTKDYAVGAQDAVDSVSCDAEFLGKAIGRSATNIFVDEVVEIRRVPFSGHVYNLETDSGIYSANGIITHNCRCTVFVKVDFLAGLQ